MLCTGHTLTGAKRVDAIHDHRVAGRPQCRVTLHCMIISVGRPSCQSESELQDRGCQDPSAVLCDSVRKRNKIKAVEDMETANLQSWMRFYVFLLPLSCIENVHILGFGTWFDHPGALGNKNKLFLFGLECDFISLVVEHEGHEGHSNNCLYRPK